MALAMKLRLCCTTTSVYADLKGKVLVVYFEYWFLENPPRCVNNFVYDCTVPLC